MKITLQALRKRKEPTIEKVIIHSLDQALYQVSVILDDKERYLADNNGQLLRSHNVLSLQAMFDGIKVEQMVLRQQSAYDEMIGQPGLSGSNTLEVPLGNNRLGVAT